MTHIFFPPFIPIVFLIKEIYWTRTRCSFWYDPGSFCTCRSPLLTSDSVSPNIRADGPLNGVLATCWDSINLEASDGLSLGSPGNGDGCLSGICHTGPARGTNICTRKKKSHASTVGLRILTAKCLWRPLLELCTEPCFWQRIGSQLLHLAKHHWSFVEDHYLLSRVVTTPWAGRLVRESFSA